MRPRKLGEGTRQRGATVSKIQGTAEVFWTAFQSLQPRERQAVIRRILEDKSLQHDVQDLATIDRRRSEPARPLRDYLKDSR